MTKLTCQLNKTIREWNIFFIIKSLKKENVRYLKTIWKQDEKYKYLSVVKLPSSIHTEPIGSGKWRNHHLEKQL